MRFITDDPISRKVDCPVCMSKAGEPCTAPTNTSRREVRWFHSLRTTKALEARRSETASEGVGAQE